MISSSRPARSPFSDRLAEYQRRNERVLADALPGERSLPTDLHAAMRYAVLNGGKRIRPLFCYATAETLGLDPRLVDAPAACIEMIHAFSLVHDDLPAMDDDELRRGKPTTHVAFGEATAILAGDALQMLAFQVLTRDPLLSERPALQVALIDLVADASGSLGMTGGQAIDLAAEGKRLDLLELETMFAKKTGCLIRASVLSACLCASVEDEQLEHFDRYARTVGLAFQIKDDVLDEEGETSVIGKPQGSDRALGKATYPALFGLAEAKARCDQLYQVALGCLDQVQGDAQALRWLTEFVVKRSS